MVEPTGNGYSAYVPDLPVTCTVGDNWEELEKNVTEAVDFHLESIIEDGDEIHDLFKSGFEFDYRLNIQDFFQLFKPVKQSVIAQRAGINPSLLRQYARGIKHPSLAQAKKIEKAIHQLGEELLRVQLV